MTLTFIEDFRQLGSINASCRSVATGAVLLVSLSDPTTGRWPRPRKVTKTFNCRDAAAAVGISGRHGAHVNAIGLNCAKFPPPTPTQPPVASSPSQPIQPIGMIFCQGAGMPLISGPMKLSGGFTFLAAP